MERKQFETWSAVVAHVRQHGSLYYKAPLDARPVYVRATVRGKAPRKVRVIPVKVFADPFWADSGHLDRMFS